MQTRLLTLIIVILLLSGCKKIDELTQFELVHDQTISIPSIIGINLPFNIPIREISFNRESEYSVDGSAKYLAEKVQIRTVEITLLKPVLADFSFLNSVEVYISAEDLPEILVAWKHDIPDDYGQFIALEYTDVDLKDYVKKDYFNLRVNTLVDELLLRDHDIALHSVFFVDAKILGQ